MANATLSLPAAVPEAPSPPAGDAPRRLLVPAALLALYVIWGSTYLVMRWALEGSRRS